jgi:hypothetical protein
MKHATKQEILKEIKKLKKKFDLTYDEQTEQLFFELEQKLNLNFSICGRGNINGTDFWLQCEYYSLKIRKTIIWSYDIGNFDDYNEIADYIIHTTNEIQDFENRLSLNE